jgi:phosphoglycolate phosphatase
MPVRWVRFITRKIREQKKLKIIRMSGGAIDLKFKAIIFDLDGTLLNTLKDLALSVNAVLEKKGYRQHSVDAYRYFVGDGIDLLVKRSFPEESWAGDNLVVLINEVKEEYSRRWADHTLPYTGVPEMLNFFDQQAIPKAIFSNKPHEFALLTVEKLLSAWRFFDVIGIGPQMPRKPDPTGALQIAEKMVLQPAEIVYLGDTDTDMKTALAGGFYPAAALWGFRPAAELEAAGANLLAADPAVVTELFK